MRKIYAGGKLGVMIWPTRRPKTKEAKPRAAIYMRVSTSEQTVEPQRIELLEWAKRNGVQVVARLTDEGQSGRKFERPGLTSLLELVRERQIDMVLCVKLDRMGRSLVELAKLISVMETHGVAIVATSQGIDTRANNPAGRLQMGVLMAVAEFEADMIRERTLAGLEAARRRGARLGRPPNAQVPANAAEVIAEWEQAGGKGYRELARRLGVDSLGTVHALVKRLRAKCVGEAMA